MTQIANKAIATSLRAELSQFLHQLLFSPPVVAIIKAIKNKQLETFPGLTQELLCRLPPSNATIKGHMYRNRKGLRSTRPPMKTKHPGIDEGDMNLPECCKATSHSNIICAAALADTIIGTIYMDFPGKFPVRSIRNMQYMFVCYSYEPNAILVRPMKNRSDECFVGAYEEVYEYLAARGFKPKLNVTDNECLKAVQKYITSKKVAWQLVGPNNHRINAAERAIQTFKNHFGWYFVS